MQVTGWATYDKTLSGHDVEQQRRNTLLMTNSLVPACRRQLPGFAAMEEELVTLLQNRYQTVVELFYAHGRAAPFSISDAPSRAPLPLELRAPTSPLSMS